MVACLVGAAGLLHDHTIALVALLGNLCVYLGGQVALITPESLVGLEQVWPTRDELVTVRSWHKPPDSRGFGSWAILGSNQ